MEPLESYSPSLLLSPPDHTEAEAEAEWSWDENKMFEIALAEELPDGFPDLFHRIATRVAGKTVGQIEKHYQNLAEDVENIEVGVVPLPGYEDDQESGEAGAAAVEKKPSRLPRKKGVPWTPEEHQLFLRGLKTYGRGDWRSISRNCVITKTPTQVASHAQKYYARLNRHASAASKSRSCSWKHNNKSPDHLSAELATDFSSSILPLNQ